MIFKIIGEHIKKFFSNRKRNILFIILAILILLDIILGLITRNVVSRMPEQLGAERWDYDGTVAQVSLFYTEDREINPDDIKKLEYNIDKKLVEIGVIPEAEEESKKAVDTIKLGKDRGQNDDARSQEKPEEVKPYNSCYSAQGKTTLFFEKRTAENIDAIGVGGDFFFFHPMELVNGSYFSPDDIMHDKLVIDEDLAWQLFGSSDVVGQCVTINGVNHYIAGVVVRKDGRINEAAGLSKSIVYMSYESLSKYGELLSGRTSSVEVSEDGTSANVGGINCYEIVMPSPVEGIAARIVKESTSLDDTYISVVDNTARFSFFKLIDVAASFGKRSMWDKPIFYPYWENIARGYEDVLALFNIIRVFIKVIFALSIATFVVLSYKNKKWTVRGIVNYLADKKYDFESARKYNKEQK